MCGILACYRVKSPLAEKGEHLKWLKRQQHRGPDWSGNVIFEKGQQISDLTGRVYHEQDTPKTKEESPALDLSEDLSGNCGLYHERLAIVGLGGSSHVIGGNGVPERSSDGAQPILSADGRYALCVNGEIYNHRIIRDDQATYPYQYLTASDSEVVIPLYEKHGIDAPNYLDGMFAFVLFDRGAPVSKEGVVQGDISKGRIIAARDPIGITTLYMGYNLKQPHARYFASELKCLLACDRIEAFPPGHVYDSNTDQVTRYFKPSWWDENKIPTEHVDLKKVRETFELAVRKRMMADVPFGVLLSGGLDSSLVSAVAARELAKVSTDDNCHETGIDAQGNLHQVVTGGKLRSFAIGLPGAPDLIAAEKVANYIGTLHTSHTFTLQEGLDSLNDVIWHLETYDVTTIRASTPMYLLSRKIKAQGIKMVLSGEGSDEIFGGYLYFAAAPSADEFHQECVKRVKNLHYADCLRANKSTMAWGLEARVPFLDKQFLEVCMNINPEDKLITSDHIEKYILRKAFDVEEGEKPYLPKEILWRQKEQFSDGVGYSWIDGLKDAAEAAVSDEQLASPKPEWGDDIPQTKEAYWYRCKFDEMFNSSKAAASTVTRWIPKAEWGCHSDPSGRYAATHDHKVADAPK